MNRKLNSLLLLTLVLSSPLWRTALAAEAALAWSTFLGGSDYDCSWDVAIDSAHCLYITGYSGSSDFPVTSGVFDATLSGSHDVLVSKFDSSGNSMIYATLLGGSNLDFGHGIGVDAANCAYITGYSESSDFPTTIGAIDTIFNGSRDVFVVKLNPSGSALLYATLLGGNQFDSGFGIALDGLGNAFVTGGTSSSDFPTTIGAFDTSHHGCEDDAFAVKIDPSGSMLDYATFLGGDNSDFGYDIAVDALGNVFVTGGTSSADFPVTPLAFDTTHNGSNDAFVAKLDPSGSALVFATFLGGNSFDKGAGIVIDGAGNASVIGTTESPDFPTTAAALDTAYSGNYEVFVAQLNALGSAPIFSTFLGGSGYDYGYDIARDEIGFLYATGSTESADFPASTGAFDASHNGSDDVFVAKFNPAGSALEYATFLGGSSPEEAHGITIDGDGNVYLTGPTMSADFPITAEAFDTTHNGHKDIFVTKLHIGTEDPNPPEVVADLTITLCEEYLVLQWTAVTVNTNGSVLVADFYHIYRDSTSFFDQEANPFDSTSNTYYVDSSGVVGDTQVHHYYTVTAVSGGMESEFSGEVGAIDRQLVH